MGPKLASFGLNFLKDKVPPFEVYLLGNVFYAFGGEDGHMTLVSDIIEYTNAIEVA